MTAPRYRVAFIVYDSWQDKFREHSHTYGPPHLSLDEAQRHADDLNREEVASGSD